MEAHEYISLTIICLIFDFTLIHISWDGIVDIEKSNRTICDTCSDILGESSVDIDFTRNWYSTGSKA